MKKGLTAALSGLFLIAGLAVCQAAGAQAFEMDSSCRSTLVAPNEVICLTKNGRLFDLRWGEEYAKASEMVSLGPKARITEFKGTAIEDGRLYLAWIEDGDEGTRVRVLFRKASGSVAIEDVSSLSAGTLPHGLEVFVSRTGAIRVFYVLTRTRGEAGKTMERWDEVESLLWSAETGTQKNAILKGEGRIIEAFDAQVRYGGGFLAVWAERPDEQSRGVKVLSRSFSPEGAPEGNPREILEWKSERKDPEIRVEYLEILSGDEGIAIQTRQGDKRLLYRKTAEGQSNEYMTLGKKERWEGFDPETNLNRLKEETYDSATGAYYTRMRWMRKDEEGICKEEFVLPANSWIPSQPIGACVVYLEKRSKGYRLGKHCAEKCPKMNPRPETQVPEEGKAPKKTSGGT